MSAITRSCRHCQRSIIMVEHSETGIVWQHTDGRFACAGARTPAEPLGDTAAHQAATEIAQRRIAEERTEAARHLLWAAGDPRGYRPGGFTEKLIAAWQSADPHNSARLRSAFPILGEGVRLLRNGGAGAVAKWAGIS